MRLRWREQARNCKANKKGALGIRTPCGGIDGQDQRGKAVSFLLCLKLGALRQTVLV